ncbi:MAG: hypothetical protein WB715_07900 [Roseiarcus sp.]|uniref:hypothetical protein n=1 Tax=Roseiarcus sp. TaxID=1969460 RepID=UPI003C691BF6
MKGDPKLAGRLRAQLKLAVMAGPMFIVRTPELVIAKCRIAWFAADYAKARKAIGIVA